MDRPTRTEGIVMLRSVAVEKKPWERCARCKSKDVVVMVQLGDDADDGAELLCAICAEGRKPRKERKEGGASVTESVTASSALKPSHTSVTRPHPGFECQHCGGKVPTSPTLRLYCSNACKQAAYRKRIREEADAAA
jgi:hypothetical protein